MKTDSNNKLFQICKHNHTHAHEYTTPNIAPKYILVHIYGPNNTVCVENCSYKRRGFIYCFPSDISHQLFLNKMSLYHNSRERMQREHDTHTHTHTVTRLCLTLNVDRLAKSSCIFRPQILDSWRFNCGRRVLRSRDTQMEDTRGEVINRETSWGRFQLRFPAQTNV